jgi:hypothetical protein
MANSLLGRKTPIGSCLERYDDFSYPVAWGGQRRVCVAPLLSFGSATPVPLMVLLRLLLLAPLICFALTLIVLLTLPLTHRIVAIGHSVHLLSFLAVFTIQGCSWLFKM